LKGKTRPFNPYKGLKSLAAYFGTALRFGFYSSRVVAPNEYHFSPVADTGDDGENQRLEDIMNATDDQLAVWQGICDAARQISRNQIKHFNDSDSDSNDKAVGKIRSLWKAYCDQVLGPVHEL
jgi:hypothetical protein